MVMTVMTILVRQEDENYIATSVLKHGKQAGVKKRRRRKALDGEKEP
jgi:hypothetical protein